MLISITPLLTIVLAEIMKHDFNDIYISTYMLLEVNCMR